MYGALSGEYNGRINFPKKHQIEYVWVAAIYLLRDRPSQGHWNVSLWKLHNVRLTLR